MAGDASNPCTPSTSRSTLEPTLGRVTTRRNRILRAAGFDPDHPAHAELFDHPPPRPTEDLELTSGGAEESTSTSSTSQQLEPTDP